MKKEPKYSLAALKKNSRELFGVSQWVFETATKNLSNSNYTITYVREIITKWLKKEVK